MGDGLYLYCIVPAGHSPPPGLHGLDDLPVGDVRLGDIAAWVSARADPPRPSLEAIERHNAVVEAAMTDRVTPVPLRFGQWIPTAAELPSMTADRAAGWAAALADLAGFREYGVRVLDPAREVAARDVRPSSATSGRAYLADIARNAEQAAHRQHDADRVAHALRIRLGPLVARERVEPLPTTHGVASIAHLVRISDAAVYRRAVDEAAATMPALRFLTSGPWPPYSFAE
ncbi:MAG: GvpL/GvpF family gas vesicle protein [Longimicrobiales bacterium]